MDVMKQTAVDWLADNLHYLHSTKWDDILEQVKEIEKEQIGRAYQEGLLDGLNHTPKDYYNETFNTNESKLK
jgi:hypothetical protein